METGLNELKELFGLKDRDLRTYSPLTLAYIGDGVYELVIRTILVKKRQLSGHQLHKHASSLVKGRGTVQNDGDSGAHSYRRRAGRLQKGKKCTFPHNGEARHNGRLQKSHRL